jgi:hypothetical protein
MLQKKRARYILYTKGALSCKWDLSLYASHLAGHKARVQLEVRHAEVDLAQRHRAAAEVLRGNDLVRRNEKGAGKQEMRHKFLR